MWGFLVPLFVIGGYFLGVFLLYLFGKKDQDEGAEFMRQMGIVFWPLVVLSYGIILPFIILHRAAESIRRKVQ